MYHVNACYVYRIYVCHLCHFVSVCALCAADAYPGGTQATRDLLADRAVATDRCRAAPAVDFGPHRPGHRRQELLSGPARGAQAASAFPTVNRFCAALLYGFAERLAVNNGGFRPGVVGLGI